ncbi:Protein of unknown function DUF3632 [Penicillium occitanis (nom. inval.)]|nr:Protein of unknown function DUF3632 [Penicillium occitanis (nom. inval.)]PCG93852.1 hypothetical protein PENOC_085630 [Penicillium occitanis (nom. inval.)]
MAEKSTSRDAGIAYLDEQISESYEGDETYELANILKHLLAENGITPQETAQQIDSFYEDKFVPSQPIFQKEKSIGMINLLGALDELLCNLGRVLRYDDVRQDALIQVILELRKLPTRQVEIWGDECTVYKDDPIFGVLVHECWNMYFVHRQTPGTPSEVQESCDQYVNLSSFIARCTSAGLLVDKHGNEYKYSTFDVSRGVEEEIPRGNIRNARILAAANYILLAGSGIRNYCHSYPSDSDRGKSARDMWNLWKEKFVAIAEGQDEDPEIKDATKKAHAIMVELDASGHDVESTS